MPELIRTRGGASGRRERRGPKNSRSGLRKSGDAAIRGVQLRAPAKITAPVVGTNPHADAANCGKNDSVIFAGTLTSLPAWFSLILRRVFVRKVCNFSGPRVGRRAAAVAALVGLSSPAAAQPDSPLAIGIAYADALRSLDDHELAGPRAVPRRGVLCGRHGGHAGAHPRATAPRAQSRSAPRRPPRRRNRSASRPSAVRAAGHHCLGSRRHRRDDRRSRDHRAGSRRPIGS